MKRPTISVVVPVYNAEKYLRRCLESIRGQTFDDLEIICVNDGSMDGSLDILNEFAKKDKRFRVISQANGGINSARATGYGAANGIYVTCVDSDDFLNQNMYERMMVEDKSCDVIICNYSFYPKSIKNKKLWYRQFEGDNDWHFIARNTVPWNKIIKKNLLDKLDIYNLFLEMGENAYSIILASTDKIATIDEPLYNYRVGHTSLSTNYKNVDWFEQVVKDNKKKYEFARGAGFRKDTCLYFFYCYLYYNLILITIAAKNGERKIYNNAKEVIKAEGFFGKKYKEFFNNNCSYLKRLFLRRFIYPNYYVARIMAKLV